MKIISSIILLLQNYKRKQNHNMSERIPIRICVPQKNVFFDHFLFLSNKIKELLTKVSMKSTIFEEAPFCKKNACI